MPATFALAAGREDVRSAMRNRFYNNVSRPGSYGFAPRQRGVRGLGTVCDDEGASLGVSIFGAIANIGGSLLSSSGRSTVGDDGAKSGGDRGRADAGAAVGAIGSGVVDAWTAACLSSTRGSATGAAPTESMESVLSRARAEWEATATADRAEASELELERERAAREDDRARETRNYMIGGAVAVLLVGGAVFVATRRR